MKYITYHKNGVVHNYPLPDELPDNFAIKEVSGSVAKKINAIAGALPNSGYSMGETKKVTVTGIDYVAEIDQRKYYTGRNRYPPTHGTILLELTKAQFKKISVDWLRENYIAIPLGVKERAGYTFNIYLVIGKPSTKGNDLVWQECTPMKIGNTDGLMLLTDVIQYKVNQLGELTGIPMPKDIAKKALKL